MRNIKTKVLFSWSQTFEIDVYIDNEDDTECIRDYIEDVVTNKKDIILNDIIEGNESTRVGLNTTIIHMLDENQIEILNEDKINDIIITLNTNNNI